MAAKTEWKKVSNKDFNPLINVREKKGQETTGVYRGIRIVEKEGDTSSVHSIEQNGVVSDFWGTGQLNYLLKSVEEGAEVKIVYLGLEKVTMKIKGKKVSKECHQFEVFSK